MDNKEQEFSGKVIPLETTYGIRKAATPTLGKMPTMVLNS